MSAQIWMRPILFIENFEKSGPFLQNLIFIIYIT